MQLSVDELVSGLGTTSFKKWNSVEVNKIIINLI